MYNSTPKNQKPQELEKLCKLYRSASFLKSAAKVSQLPEDTGAEVAIVGRSNAGKSTFLNFLTGQKGLAKTSKTPGRTQLMNVFTLQTADKRLVDLPGYGFAKVSQSLKFDWEKHLGEYLHDRQSLQGVILLMDIRHPLQPLDNMMISTLVLEQLPVHILLTKADKLSKNTVLQTVRMVQKQLAEVGLSHCVQSFSVQQPQSLTEVVAVLDAWLDPKTRI
jgi:GTP-binding protein